MKAAYRECDFCSKRLPWSETFPKGWAILKICGGPDYEMCPKCIPEKKQ